MLDTDLGKRLDVFFQLLHEFRRRHVTVLLNDFMVAAVMEWWSDG
jgi:aryl carrier-like protein